jgi:hypothetical protein
MRAFWRCQFFSVNVLTSTVFASLFYITSPLQALASPTLEAKSFSASPAMLSRSKATSVVHSEQRPYGKRELAFVSNNAARNDLWTGANSQIHLAQGSISVSPNVVETGTAPSVTITTSGLFDLSEVHPSQIGIRPSDGVSEIRIFDQTAQTLVLSFHLEADTPTGTRTLFIRIGAEKPLLRSICICGLGHTFAGRLA